MPRKYNNNINVSKNINKYNRVNKIKKDTADMTSAEKLAYIYSGQTIDTRDSSGILLLNSGMNFRTNKPVKRENKELTKLIDDMFHRNVFQDIAKKTNKPEEMIIKAVDYNGRVNISTTQKTKTFSSIPDIKNVYNNFVDLRNQSGLLFIFDTETIGGKSNTGIWNPLGITEFAMQEVNLGTNDYKSTNIVMGIAPTKQNLETKKRILELMEKGEWDAIERDEMLAVTAKRVGLYADADIDYSGPYAKISKLASSDDNPWKNKERFLKGWENLENAYKTSAITNNGLRASDEAFLNSIVQIQTNLNNRTGMVMGQNFQIFDDKVINNQLRQMQYTYEQIAKGTKQGLVMGNNMNINQGDAINALNYINQQLAGIGGGLNMYNDLTFDTLPFFAVARDYFGVDKLYNGNTEMIKKAKGGTAKQEFIGEAWFPDLFNDNNAHMADFDVTVLRYLATQQNPNAKGQTVLDYIMNDMGATKKHKGGILNIADGHKLLTEGQVFYAKGSGDKRYAGKSLLNFTYNEKTGEVFTNSGYNFVNGKSMGWNNKDINMGTNLKRGQFYRIEQIKKVSADDLSKNMGLVMPDMSGTEFFHVQMKMQLPNTKGQDDLDYITYNYLFNSEKELAGFFSSEAKLALEQDDKGVYHISKGAEDLFEWMKKESDGTVISLNEQLGLSEPEKIQRALQNATKEYKAEKAYNAILDSDKSHKKIQQMIDAKKYLVKQGLDKVSAQDLNDLIDGKAIKDLDSDQAKRISEKLNNIFGFYSRNTKEQVLYSNTQRNIVNSWSTVSSQSEFFDTVLQQLQVVAKNKQYNDAQKNFVFQELVESFRIQAVSNLEKRSGTDLARRVAGSQERQISLYDVKRFFDIKLPDSFNQEKSHVIDITSNVFPEEYKNILRIDLNDSNASYNLVNKLRNAKYGDTKLLADTDVYNRKAFSSFMKNMKEDYGHDKWFTSIHKKVLASDDYNVDEAAREFIKFVQHQKKKDPFHGYIKELGARSLDMTIDNKLLGKELNKVTAQQVSEMLTKNIVDPIDSAKLLKTKDGMKDFIKNNVMQYYMPNKQEFMATVSNVFDPEAVWVKETLYDKLYDNISSQIEDVLSMTTRIEGAETYIDKSGNFIVSKGGKAVNVASIPKVKMTEGTGHLYGELGRQKFNLNLAAQYNDKGQLVIGTNLGEKFTANKRVSNSIRRKLKDGSFVLEDIHRYTNFLSDDFREQSVFAGTSGDLLSNFYFDTSDFDKLLPELFKDDGGLNAALDKMGFPEEVKERLRNSLPDNMDPGSLDPAKMQMMGAFRISLMKELAEMQTGDNDEQIRILSTANASGKDKSKLGKEKYVIGGIRFHTGFMDTINENSRPVIGGAGNVYYVKSENVAKAAQAATGTFYEGGLFESKISRAINNLDTKYSGKSTTTFSGRIGYINQIGIDELLNQNAHEIIARNTVNFQTKEQATEVYNFLHSFINTFEQAKVFDAEVFDNLTNGSFSANVQSLSASKEIIKAIDTAADKSLYDDIVKIRGTFSMDANGKLKYISDAGKIVKQGDAILPYMSYGDTTKNWVSKMHKGLLRYTVRDEDGMFLSDDQISNLINDNISRFAMIDPADTTTMSKAMEELFEELGLNAGYTIEDLNKTTLPKILVNNSEKSMNQLAYMRIGTIDKNIRGVLEEFSDESKDLIGKNVPSRQALRAVFAVDEAKADLVFKKFGFKNLEDFTNKAFIESYAANKMMFGKGGLFEGFVAIGNDNLLGHKNKGAIMQGALDQAIVTLGKWKSGNLQEDETSRLLGLQRVVDLVNNNDEYKFFKNSSGKKYGLSIVGTELDKDGNVIKAGHLSLDGGVSLKEGAIDFDMADMGAVKALLEKMDEEIVAEGKALGVSDDVLKRERLVHTEVVKNPKTGQDETITYVGSMIYDKNGNIYGSVGIGDMKLTIDPETQSGMNAGHLRDRRKIRSLEKQREDIQKQIKGLDPALIPDSVYEELATLGTAIEALQQKVMDWEDTGHYYRLGDRERNILTQHVISEDLFKIMDRDVDEGYYTRQVLEENEAYRSFSRDLVKDKKIKAFDFIEKEATEKSYYNPLDEKLLTKDMVENDAEYKKYKKIYETITEKQGYQLGVDNAKELYEIQSIEAANKYNNAIGKTSIDDLINDYDYEKMTPAQYMAEYGDIDKPIDDTLVKKNVILDLGDDFAESERYIAVPGSGSVVGNAEIKRSWQTDAGRLAKYYQENYATLQGDEASKDKVVEKIMEFSDTIAEDTRGYVKKKGLVHQRMNYELEVPTNREKLLSVPSTSPLLERSQVHGKSLKYWRDNGIYYDAVWHDIEHFEKAGYFDDDMLEKMGMSSKEEMIEYLETHGSLGMDDRYPNIYDTSMAPTRHYLFRPEEVHSTNATYATQETMLKVLGDSDGDSLTSFAIANNGVLHMNYEKHKMDAIAEVDKASTGLSNDAREALIKQKVMTSMGISEKVYDDFRNVDMRTLVEGAIENQTWHRRVNSTIEDDLIKTKKAQTVFNSRDGIIAELPGGKSILGREKYSALSYDPTISEIEESISNVDSILTKLRDNKDLLNNVDGKYDEILNGTKSIVDFEKEINIMDTALEGLRELTDQGVFDVNGDRQVGEAYQSAMENIVRQRVRMNNYHNEIMSKLGITAVGNVNSAFYGATQAAKNYFMTEGTQQYDPLKAQILSVMATEVEQASISSKKAEIKAGDARVVDLGTMLNKAQNGGLGIKGEESYDELSDWLHKYMDKGKVIKQYENISRRTDLVNYAGGKFNFNIETQADEIFDFMIDQTIQTYSEIWTNDTTKPIAQAYKWLGTGSARPGTMQALRGQISSDSSNAARVIAAITNHVSSGPSVIPQNPVNSSSSAVNQVVQNSIQQMSQNLSNNQTNNTLKKISAKAASIEGGGVGMALGVAVLGLAAGLITAGYASGNPLNDANPETVTQEPTARPAGGPTFSTTPQMAPNNTGGYIINIKGDTKEGNRQLKRAMKEAAKQSTGGGVNINMSLRTSQPGGYDDRDIENILNEYI